MPRRQEDRHDAVRIAKRVGTRLRLMRKKLHWTQDDVSERIGLTSEAYARIERGHSLPSFPTFLRLCATMHTRPDVLLVDANDELKAVGAEGGDESAATHEDIASLVFDLRQLDPRIVRDVGHLVRTFRDVGQGIAAN